MYFSLIKNILRHFTDSLRITRIVFLFLHRVRNSNSHKIIQPTKCFGEINKISRQNKRTISQNPFCKFKKRVVFNVIVAARIFPVYFLSSILISKSSPFEVPKCLNRVLDIWTLSHLIVCEVAPLIISCACSRREEHCSRGINETR